MDVMLFFFQDAFAFSDDVAKDLHWTALIKETIMAVDP